MRSACRKKSPSHPLGYLLEAEALWWRIWCTSAEFKYGMTDAHHRPKLRADQHYFDLSASASSIAQAHLREHETAEMQFYAGLARCVRRSALWPSRRESRHRSRRSPRPRAFSPRHSNGPRTRGCRLWAGPLQLLCRTRSAPSLSCLASSWASPAGNKQEGIRQLEHDIADGVLTPAVARFYLALDLHRYDQQYEKALAVIGPLVEKISVQSAVSTGPRRSVRQVGPQGAGSGLLPCRRGALPVHDARMSRPYS